MCSDPDNLAAKRDPYQWLLDNSETECGPQSASPRHPASMQSNSVLHDSLSKSGGTQDNGDEIIFQSLRVPFSIHRAVNKCRTDFSVTGHCTSHSYQLRVEIFLDQEQRVLSSLNTLSLCIDEPIQMKVGFLATGMLLRKHQKS